MISVSVMILSSSNSALCTGVDLMQALGQYLLQHEAGMRENE